MAISITSIHKPLNDFFLNKFKTNADSPILFRFDQFGSVVSDSDFIDPNHPDFGYLPALAMEKFSDLVNHIPVDTGDGTNIVLSADSIDTTYFYRLLAASVPYIPLGIDDDKRQLIKEFFDTIKAQSKKIYEQVKAESSIGFMLDYMPSVATPEKWYDRSNNEAWSSYAFQINESSSELDTSPSTELWKLKLSDAAVLHALQLPMESQPQLNIAARVMEIKSKPIDAGNLARAHLMTREGPAIRLTGSAIGLAVEEAAVADVAKEAPTVRLRGRGTAAVRVTAEEASVAGVERVRIVHMRNPIAGEAEVAPTLPNVLLTRFELQDNYIEQSKALSVSKRLQVNRYLNSRAETEPARTRSMSISFDYCLVKIRRLWFMDAFISDKNWYVPNTQKGHVSSSGPIPLSLMPIGFVAIRNLKIESNNWAPEDIVNASVATQFGPFRVTGSIANNVLSAPGLQIIGWMLQKMPDLPPNDPPS